MVLSVLLILKNFLRSLGIFLLTFFGDSILWVSRLQLVTITYVRWPLLMIKVLLLKGNFVVVVSVNISLVHFTPNPLPSLCILIINFLRPILLRSGCCL
jgi:hypothetical protein